MHIFCSAPTKVIITGEHAGVHGCPMLALPVEKRNSIELETVPGPAGIEFRQHGSPSYRWVWKSGGDFKGTAAYRGLFEETKHIFKEKNASLESLGFGIRASLHYAFAPKGMGSSASVAAAYGLALYAGLGLKPTPRQMFDAVQVAEKIAHGNPSGIDARTVLSATAQRFQKSWTADGTASFKFQDVSLRLPKGTTLFLVDTRRRGVTPESTAVTVARFSQTLVGKKPAEVTPAEREKIVAPFVPVVKAIIAELHETGNPIRLGELFLENNALLAKAGVVPASMQAIVNACVQEGALGAKGTGGCGEGGAVLGLCYARNLPHLVKALRRKGYSCIETQPALGGPRVEIRE